jgi:hypothetical protein
MQGVKVVQRPANLESAIRSAFWSGNLPEKKWRRAIREPSPDHKTILKTSFDHMPAVILVSELGERAFIKRWPEIRKLFDRGNVDDQKRLLLFDSTWGILATGDSQYPVSEKVASMSRGRLGLLREIVNYPGVSIYALSLKVHRQYSRVFKEVKLLVQQRLVEIRKDEAQGRRISKLYPRESINAKLADSSGRLG